MITFVRFWNIEVEPISNQTHITSEIFHTSSSNLHQCVIILTWLESWSQTGILPIKDPRTAHLRVHQLWSIDVLLFRVWWKLGCDGRSSTWRRSATAYSATKSSDSWALCVVGSSRSPLLAAVWRAAWTTLVADTWFCFRFSYSADGEFILNDQQSSPTLPLEELAQQRNRASHYKGSRP